MAGIAALSAAIVLCLPGEAQMRAATDPELAVAR